MKDYLKSETKLADPRPLINVCDKHDMVEELTAYLYSKSMVKFIEVRRNACPSMLAVMFRVSRLRCVHRSAFSVERSALSVWGSDAVW